MASIKLGFTSFGGPVAHLAYFKDEYIDRRKWLGALDRSISKNPASFHYNLFLCKKMEMI
nr:chromate transporter [Lentibacillus cibarius]